MNLGKLNDWKKMGPRAMFGQFMTDIAKRNKRLIILTADLGRSSGLDRFKLAHPDKFISVGICEQNLIGVASGMAREGYKVFVTSFAPFLSMRASEQIRMNLGYMKTPVNIIALGSGLSMGFLGNSHYGLEDVGIIRTIPNIKIFAPADCLELRKTLFDVSFHERGPCYIRLTGVPGSPITYEKNYKYDYNMPNLIFKGKDCLVLSYGSVLGEIKEASKYLKEKNITFSMVNIQTLKPFNKKIIKNYINKFKYIIIIEEHTKVGGLWSIITENYINEFNNKKFLNISLPDKFGPTGSYNYLLNYHGLNAKRISERIEKFVK